MTKLIAEGGKIRKVSQFVSGPISMSCRAAFINTDGDLGRVVIERDGQKVEMTYPQALSLANEIVKRCS